VRQIYFIITLVFVVFPAFSQVDFNLTNSNCFGNEGIDKIQYHFETPDGCTIALVAVEHQSGYFQSDFDSSIWLVKFDNHLNLTAKVLVAKENVYSLGFDFKINPANNTILCVADSFSNNISYINRLIVFDYNLNTLSVTHIGEKKNFEVYINANKSGGYVVNYNTYNVNYEPDSMAILLIDADGLLRFKKYISYSQLDTFKHLAYTPTTYSSIQNWLTDIVYDAGYLYTTSVIYFWDQAGSQKIGLIGMTLDSNLNVKDAKLLENKFQEGSGIGKYTLCQLNDSSFLYVYNEDLNSMRLYFVNDKFDTISSPFIANKGNYYNYILSDKFDYYNSHKYNIQIKDNLVYIPYFHKIDSCANFSFCSSSSILCFNFNGQLVKEIKLDSIPNGLQQEIVYYKILSDLSIITYTENVTGNGSDLIISKFNKIGNHIWSYTLPREIIWRNKVIGEAKLDFLPQIISNAGKERTLQLFMQYKNGYPSQYDTIILVNFEINLQNGRQLNSYNLASLIENNQNNYSHKWNKIRKISDDNFSSFGTTTILCSNNNYIDIFTGISSKNFNTIVSAAYLDLNSNSMLDSNELYLDNLFVNITKNNSTTESYFDENDHIISYVDTGKYDISINPSLDYFNSIPSSVTKNYTAFGSTDTLIFALQPTAIVNDLMVQLNNNGRGRPGFNGSYMMNVSNNGTTIQHAIATLKLSENIDSVFTFPAAEVNNDTLIWTLNNLVQNEQKIIEIYFHYKEPPFNAIGDTLISTAFVSPTSNDTLPLNNVSVLKDVLSGSFDPNDKLTDKSEYTASDLKNKEYIKYTIRFENTGNDTAFRIEIIDTLDRNLDVATFKPLKSEYNYTTKITSGNVAIFTFNPISLPSKTTSAISYLIKPQNSISNGMYINNKASIKFDYNEPVVSNSTQTRISIITKIQNSITSTNYKLFPNPANDAIFIEIINPKNENYFQILDLNGNVIKDFVINDTKSIKLDITKLSIGMYIINFVDKYNQSSSTKFIITR
jgi:uncharacterized repeat protein (TIGR01451 family)